MKTFWIILVIMAVLVLGYFGYKALYPTYPTTSNIANSTSVPVAGNQIIAKGFAFTPNALTTSIGQEVSFTNNDVTTHIIVADDNSFTSGPLAPGQTYKHKFSAAGTYAYHCSIHPYMTGKVIVQ